MLTREAERITIIYIGESKRLGSLLGLSDERWLKAPFILPV